MAFVYSLVGASAALSATNPIADESLRMDALRAVFPKTTISLVVGSSTDDSWRPAGHSKQFLFADALATENVYRLVGPASGPAEQCAASDVTNDSLFSEIRELRFEVFRWPGAADSSSLLAVFQYRFLGSNPPLSYPSIAHLARVTNTNGKWPESAGFDLDTTHHTSIQRIELTSLDGHHSQELLMESDWGCAGVVGTNLVVFSLSRGRFNQWLNVPSRVYSSAGGDSYVESLELPSTRQHNADRFCFRRIMFATNGLWLSQPVETHRCYPRFAGQSAKAEFYNAR
ncbi:MAG: hypothetical protein WBQ34_00915 [Candidatus Acidiferrales bacterium]